jgi:hypothetical protein
VRKNKALMSSGGIEKWASSTRQKMFFNVRKRVFQEILEVVMKFISEDNESFTTTAEPLWDVSFR